MQSIYINAIGLTAPGLTNWENSLPVLRDETNYQAEPLDRYKPMLLPANERRRATELVRLAFRVSEEATQNLEAQRATLASVFASSGGDYQIIDQICRALSMPERMVSPTQFHNSVHNSAAGYWSIATQSRAPSTSLSAYDYSFPVGLLEAATLVVTDNQPTLLVAYDTQPPSPLAEKRQITLPFATALVLAPAASEHTLAKLSLSTITGQQSETTCQLATLETLRASNPAASSLPLLELLAKQQPGQISLALNPNQQLMVELEPWQNN